MPFKGRDLHQVKESSSHSHDTGSSQSMNSLWPPALCRLFAGEEIDHIFGECAPPGPGLSSMHAAGGTHAQGPSALWPATGFGVHSWPKMSFQCPRAAGA